MKNLVQILQFKAYQITKITKNQAGVPQTKPIAFLLLLSRGERRFGGGGWGACLIEQSLGDVADVPVGATGGDDHVVGAGTAVPPALTDGEHPHVARLDVAQHLLHLRQLQKLRLPRGRGGGGGEEARRRPPPAQGLGSHGGEHRQQGVCVTVLLLWDTN